MRILVTGSRDWTDRDDIGFALLDHHIPAHALHHTLVSGACPTGADRIAEEFAAKWDWAIERHPADWATHGKAAGPIRNAEMVALGADVCLAFIRNKSRGAWKWRAVADADA